MTYVYARKSEPTIQAWYSSTLKPVDFPFDLASSHILTGQGAAITHYLEDAFLFRLDEIPVVTREMDEILWKRTHGKKFSVYPYEWIEEEIKLYEVLRRIR